MPIVRNIQNCLENTEFTAGVLNFFIKSISFCRQYGHHAVQQISQRFSVAS